MSESGTWRETLPVSGWATGGVLFAAVLMMVVGIFQVLQGLAAIIERSFFVLERSYAFELNVQAWGWIHLLLGIVVAASGYALLVRREWAAYVTIALAVIVAVGNFFFIPYSPVWSIVVIALALWVIWSLTRPGVLEEP